MAFTVTIYKVIKCFFHFFIHKNNRVMQGDVNFSYCDSKIIITRSFDKK